jgi:hypothetical protein
MGSHDVQNAPPKKPPGGRPTKEVDMEVVGKLAALALTQEEIAAVLNVSVDTLSRREGFAEVYKQGRNTANASIRRAQFEKGVKHGNTRMLIWLGKQYLRQSDRLYQEHAGPGGGPLQVEALRSLGGAELDVYAEELEKRLIELEAKQKQIEGPK